MPRAKLISRRTKIICTLGPASFSTTVIENLMKSGMDIVRLNLSHGTLDEHARYIEIIRESGKRLGVNVSILLDLPGPKYRIGKLMSERITLETGAQLILTTRPVAGTAELLPVNLPTLPKDVKRGETVLLNDGAIELKVLETGGTDVKCRVIVGGTLTEGRGLVVPGMKVSAPFMVDSLRDGLEFAAKHQPDYLALSFVSSAENVAEARAVLRQKGADIPVICKIEHANGVKNFDSILAASDGIMVARGDLGVEIRLERVPLIQKEIIKKCNRAGKPVITATEMLMSMVDSIRPTRAETTDVANAIFDGTDATMLSQETAIGKYPVQAVRMMDAIAREAENKLPYEQILAEREKWLEPETDELIAYNACLTAQILKAVAIVAFTQSGSTARRVSQYRPKSPILALTTSDTVFRRLVLRWGVHPRLITELSSVDELFETGARVAGELELAKKGDLIVITAGIPIGVAGSTNLLKVQRIN